MMLLADKEIKTSNDDPIDFKWFAHALRKVILNTETPMTIGIFGEWGSGKTSIMRMTEDLLKNEAKTIWFNAWKYNCIEDLRLSLIKTILKEIGKNKKVSDKAIDLSKKVNLLGIAKTTTSILLGSTSINLDEIINKDESISIVSEFEDKFSQLIRDYSGDYPFVIFIDDLDRCLPERAIDVLESIKLFLDVENCIFIVGINKEIIEKGLKLKYNDDTFKAQNYMEKIIQLTFNIPKLREEDAKDLIEYLAPEKIKPYKDIMAKVGKNPRMVKRIMNKFIFQTIIAEENPRIRIDYEILAKFSVLETRWNEFFIAIINSYNADSKSSMLLTKAEDVCRISSSQRKKIISEMEGELKKYLEDEELLDFLSNDPQIWNINLDPYIYLRIASTLDNGLSTKLEWAINKNEPILITNELIKNSIRKVLSYDPAVRKLGLAEIRHGWLNDDFVDKNFVINELLRACERETNSSLKKEMIDLIYEISAQSLNS